MVNEMHGQQGRSTVERLSLVAMHAVGVGVAAWLLVGSGLAVVGGWVDASWSPGDATRRGLLLACALVYFCRVTFGSYFLIKRRMGWQEVGSVGPFMIGFHIAFAAAGATVTSAVGTFDYVAIGLYIVGSFFNTGSELIRHLWKKHPENKGKIYTGGLFALSMHVNYFGDTLLFSGYAMLTFTWWTGSVPALMTIMFVAMHIPTLDTYLAERYGAQFDDYAATTKKFIPYIY